MAERVAIIGAGVSGLTCGVLLAEAGFEAQILAEEVGPQTTSAAAGAIWYPYDAEPAAAVIAWSLRTFEFLRELSADSSRGVSMLELRVFSRLGEIEIPEWAVSLGAELLRPPEVPDCFKSGFTLCVPLTDTSIYLEYLAQRFRRAGGRIEAGVRFNDLDQVPRDYSLIINCTGIGARTLVPDRDLEPHRGQVVLVPRPGVPYAVVCDDPPLMYSIPRANDCVFGGTNEISENRRPDPATTAAIVAECSRVLGIESPGIIGECVGLRPYRRTGIRLERESLSDRRVVVHNYGHGGSGFTLSWGCAEEVLAVVRRTFSEGDLNVAGDRGPRSRKRINRRRGKPRDSSPPRSAGSPGRN